MTTENEKTVRDPMREAFEKWVRKDKAFYWRWLDRIDGDPDYCAGDIQRLWEAWQAALQSQVSNTDGWVMVNVSTLKDHLADLDRTADVFEAHSMFAVAEETRKAVAELEAMLSAAPKAPKQVSNTPAERDGWVMVPVWLNYEQAAKLGNKFGYTVEEVCHTYADILDEVAAPKAPQKVSNTPQDGRLSAEVDEDGENQALRVFLMGYGGSVHTIEGMRDHLHYAGYDGHWPGWAKDSTGHLTKLGAQNWIRHLIAMEQPSTPPQQQESADMQEIVDAYKHLHKGKFGMHWLWAAILRINAGESEQSVMNDFGYVFDIDAALQSQSPEWKLVPVEPTNAMVEAAELDACGRLLADDIADAYSAMLSAAPTPPQHQESGEADEPLSEWLATEISAIDCEYRGDPSYTHDAYWMREAVLGFIEKYKSVIDTYSTPSTPSESQAGTTQEAVAWDKRKFAEELIRDICEIDEPKEGAYAVTVDLDWLKANIIETIPDLYPAPPQVDAAVEAFRLAAIGVCQPRNPEQDEDYEAGYVAGMQWCQKQIRALPGGTKALEEFGMRVAERVNKEFGAAKFHDDELRAIVQAEIKGEGGA